MPLLKGRFVVSVKPLADVKPDETIYTIPHTNEQFRSLEYLFVAVCCRHLRNKDGGAHKILLFFAKLYISGIISS